MIYKHLNRFDALTITIWINNSQPFVIVTLNIRKAVFHLNYKNNLKTWLQRIYFFLKIVSSCDNIEGSVILLTTMGFGLWILKVWAFGFDWQALENWVASPSPREGRAYRFFALYRNMLCKKRMSCHLGFSLDSF